MDVVEHRGMRGAYWPCVTRWFVRLALSVCVLLGASNTARAGAMLSDSAELWAKHLGVSVETVEMSRQGAYLPEMNEAMLNLVRDRGRNLGDKRVAAVLEFLKLTHANGHLTTHLQGHAEMDVFGYHRSPWISDPRKVEGRRQFEIGVSHNNLIDRARHVFGTDELFRAVWGDLDPKMRLREGLVSVAATFLHEGSHGQFKYALNNLLRAAGHGSSSPVFQWMMAQHFHIDELEAQFVGARASGMELEEARAYANARMGEDGYRRYRATKGLLDPRTNFEPWLAAATEATAGERPLALHELPQATRETLLARPRPTAPAVEAPRPVLRRSR